MKLLLDENFPHSAVDAIEEAGHEFFDRFDEPLTDKVFILRDFSCRVK